MVLRDLVNTNKIILNTLKQVERIEKEAKVGFTKKRGLSNQRKDKEFLLVLDRID